MERKVLIKALFGSHNYNLNDENSDRDYKYFVAPTFDDLYEGKMFSTSKVGKEFDYDVHDIRKIPQLFWKSNINFIEILYSKDIKVGEDVVWGRTQYSLNQIFKMKDKLVTMNIPYFYNACMGMHFNKMKYLMQGTEGTKHLVEKFGYDTKQALHAYRVLDFITRFADNEFTDFQKAISYDDNEKEFMLAIKHGKYTEEEFRDLVKKKYNEFDQYKEVYAKQKPDQETYEELNDIVKYVVKLELDT